jgi:hypothetical protein
LDTLNWLHLLRDLHVDFDPCHKSALVTNLSKFERVSELVRKVFTSSRCYLYWYLLNVELTLMAWFWRVFILLFAQWRTSTWVFGPQVAIAGWSSKVRLGVWYVWNVSIIFDAPCLFLHHLPCVSLHFVAFLCDFRN